jgi:flagellar hook assembly protein FlgD
VVHWPSGVVQIRADVPGNRRIVLVEAQTTGVEDASPPLTRLWPPAPNPSGAITRFRLDVASSRRLRVEVVDLEGRSVRLIADREFEPGRHDLSWDGLDSSGRLAPAGTYFVRVGPNSARQVQRFARLR